MDQEAMPAPGRIVVQVPLDGDWSRSRRGCILTENLFTVPGIKQVYGNVSMPIPAYRSAPTALYPAAKQSLGL